MSLMLFLSHIEYFLYFIQHLTNYFCTPLDLQYMSMTFYKCFSSQHVLPLNLDLACIHTSVILPQVR